MVFEAQDSFKGQLTDLKKQESQDKEASHLADATCAFMKGFNKPWSV